MHFWDGWGGKNAKLFLWWCNFLTFANAAKRKRTELNCRGFPTEWKRNICSHVKSMGRRHRLFGQLLLRLQHPERSAVLRSWSGVVCVITETECVVVPSDSESRGVVDWARVI